MSPQSAASAALENNSNYTLPEMLLEEARLQPEACAIVAGEEEVTYGRLVTEARSLGALIRSAGIVPDETVGIFAEPGGDLPLLVWGALFSGAAYLPLAADYPDDRLRYMIEASGTRLILTQRHLVSRIGEIAPDGTQVICLDDTATAAEDTVPPAGPAVGSNLAYCIYTSGSTGRPKGVMIEHASIVAQLNWLRGQGHLRPGVRILQKTPMSFDAAQWEILAPAVGATAVMGEPELYRNPYGLVELIDRHAVTHLQCVPTLLQALLETEGFDECASLTSVYCGGEALSKPLARQFFEALPGRSLTNLYGPTETTINSLAHTVTAADLAGSDVSIPIGEPVPGAFCAVLDEHLKPLADGESGDLYIGGIQLARGYLNNPEQTAERFINTEMGRLYKTGDVVRRNADGLYYFQGRSDNQVKLRGYRVELEEISSAIEHHQWVRRAAAVVTTNARTGNPELVACVEMNPNEAALMDQGSHGAHHQSKQNKLQVKAQLSNPGIRSDLSDGIELPGRDGDELRAAAFARKTYRFYDGGPLAEGELEAFLAQAGQISAPSERSSEGPVADLGYALRWIGQFQSAERLLPKYSYASPGALYAVQAYLELQGQDGIDDGIYYYHPELHTLQLAAPASGRPASSGIRIHLIGKTGAIEPVYKTNILEVLEFEAGHLLGALQDGLAAFGKTVAPHSFEQSVGALCGALDEDYYLGTFEVVDGIANHLDDADLFVNIPGSKVPGVAPGTYAWNGTGLEPVATEVIQRKHVIAINQRVFDRSSFGVTAVPGQVADWLKYITLGCTLHRVQRNGAASGLGFMSSGYSSKTGNPLPASRRIKDILNHHGIAVEACYFFIGGRVTAEQIASEGMNEDLVHMQGPAEMVREELEQTLPDYMVPHRTVVFDELPLTPNGKVDLKALAAAPQIASPQSTTDFVAPSTPTQKRLAVEWAQLLKYDDVSVHDDFFAVGGNSLMSITLISRIGRIFGVQLPLRALIDTPTLDGLAHTIDQAQGQEPAAAASRFIPLNPQAEERPVYCWPGLGGYPMNLMKLAGRAMPERPFFGIQARGINAGETPYATIQEMASADIAEMLKLQPEGPYTLWGYSFGARVAFEAAWQLEQAGKTVDRLMLICPGNPSIREGSGSGSRSADFTDPGFVTVLASVFLGTSTGPQIDECVEATRDRDSFVEFIGHARRELGLETINRITDIVVRTFEFEYTFSELLDRRITAPITIFKAAGDDYSFIESAGTFAQREPQVVTLSEDHYAVLRDQGVDELAAALRSATDDPTLSEARKASLAGAHGK